MSDCFSCGKQFSENTNAILRGFKERYLKYGTVRYYYKLDSNGPILICRASSFSKILENEIKPNFQNGAEYAHIGEFK